jgi:hypothetical protein
MAAACRMVKNCWRGLGETGAPLRSHLGAMKILPQNGFIAADYAWLPKNTANYDFVKRITTDY